MADFFRGKILHSHSVGSSSPFRAFSPPYTLSSYLSSSILRCNPHRYSTFSYLSHAKHSLASASSSDRLSSGLDIISTAERSDGSVVFEFGDASQIVKDLDVDERDTKLRGETADRRRDGADSIGYDLEIKSGSNSVELDYRSDSNQGHSEVVENDAVAGKDAVETSGSVGDDMEIKSGSSSVELAYDASGAVESDALAVKGAVVTNSESNENVSKDSPTAELAVSVAEAVRTSRYPELVHHETDREHSEVVESDNEVGRGAMDVKNESNVKVDGDTWTSELAVSAVEAVDISRDSEVEFAHNDGDKEDSKMVEGDNGLGRGTMDVNNELAVSAVEAQETSRDFELADKDSHLPSEIAENGAGAAKGAVDVKDESNEYIDRNTQISELQVSVVEAEETSVDPGVGLISALNFTEGSSGEKGKEDLSLTSVPGDVEKSHKPDLDDHIYVAVSSDASVLEDVELFCSEEASEDIGDAHATELSAESGCTESLDVDEQTLSVGTVADTSLLVKDSEVDNVTEGISEHSQLLMELIPDHESTASEISQCLIAENTSEILPRKSYVAAEVSEFRENDLGTKSVESTISREGRPSFEFLLYSAAASLRNPSKALTGGGDAYFIAGSNWFGVADGVGQWSLEGTQEGLYACDLMKSCECAVLNNNDSVVKDVRSILKQSAAEVESTGATRVLLANFDTRSEVLHVANIGDTGFIILRNGLVLERSCPMTHEFYFPLQVGNCDDPSEVLEEYHIDLDDGDVIVAATDGLFNNLYEQQIASIVSKSMAANMTPKQIAEILSTRAQEVGKSSSARTPFSDAAQAAGYVEYSGGKLDDVTVVVSFVQRR